MQRELLDPSTWSSRRELASAMFEWIEAFYNRGHASLRRLSPWSANAFASPRNLRHDRPAETARESGQAPSLLRRLLLRARAHRR